MHYLSIHRIKSRLTLPPITPSQRSRWNRGWMSRQWNRLKTNWMAGLRGWWSVVWSLAGEQFHFWMNLEWEFYIFGKKCRVLVTFTESNVLLQTFGDTQAKERLFIKECSRKLENSIFGCCKYWILPKISPSQIWKDSSRTCFFTSKKEAFHWWIWMTSSGVNFVMSNTSLTSLDYYIAGFLETMTEIYSFLSSAMFLFGRSWSYSHQQEMIFGNLLQFHFPSFIVKKNKMLSNRYSHILPDVGL